MRQAITQFRHYKHMDNTQKASRFLRMLQQRDSESFAAGLADPEAVIAKLLTKDPTWPEKSSTELRKIMRKRKRELVLLLAALDYSTTIQPRIPLLQLTRHLSDFAALAIDVGLESLMREQGFADTQGVTVLGMGKLGGFELNYSSDVDLIVLFDPERLNRAAEKDDNHRRIQRVIRYLVLFLEQPEAEGYIFRSDLRLRPDPSSMPLAVAVEAAVQYYETMGLAWERAAMLKARPIAGDLSLAEEFLNRISPFIWRKNLDYASIADIQAIRARTLQQRKSETLDGINIKLTEGGIREIELYAQSLQLIWGGRIPALRIKPTLEALKALADANLITADIPPKLRAAYLYYRRLEHAAQLLDDQQCHSLPETAEHWQDFATLMAEETESIKARTECYLNTVQQICQPQEQEHSELALNDDDQWLAELGYQDITALKAITERWLGGGYRLTANQRARRLLEELLPKLLKAFAATTAPDDALARMDRFLEALPAGVQLFSLFAATPELLRHCADIMGNAPRLALSLASKPSLFEYLLHSNQEEPLPILPLAVSGLEDTLDHCRRLAHEVEFRTSVGFMAGKLELDELMQQQTQTAEVIISQTLRALRQENQKLPKQGFAILALGKLGTRQLMPDSDLDLMFISSPDAETGNIPYIRLAQRLLNGLNVATAEGRLYEVDLRLRPHGDSGVLCNTFASAQQYYQDEAWLWELYALSQARVIYADSNIEEEVLNWLSRIQTQKHTIDDLRQGIQDMRPRITAAFPAQGLWDVKHHAGGLIDGGFCRQYLQMYLSPQYPELIGATFAEVLNIAVTQGLISSSLAAKATEAHDWMIRLQAGLRVSGGSKTLRLEKAPPGQRRLLSRLSNTKDFNSLETRLQESYVSVQTLYNHLFG